nr:MAG TPA: Single strand DNA binding protein [Caudoviricetes sp.]
MNTFSFVANIALGKETEKFKPYEERHFDSGWVNRTLKFNAIVGTNRFMCEIKGGSWADGHGSIKTFSENSTDSNGKRIKGDMIEIPWNERLLQSNVERVAAFKKFIIDLEVPGRRKQLQVIVEGEITDEALAAAGVSNVEQAVEAYEKSKAKRHEYISEWDFAEAVYKLLNKDNIRQRKFRVSGNLVTTEYEGNFYQHYEVNRIYLAADDAEVSAEATINVNFGKNAVDDGSVDEKGKYYINGYTFDYDSQRKTKIPCPITLALPVGTDAKSKAYVELLKKNFTVNPLDGDICKELSVRVECIDGAERLELTTDMLSENEQELLMIGAITMDELVRDRGQQVYGDRIKEYIITGFARGWLSGARLTAYHEEDFVVPPIEKVDGVTMANELFMDDEDDIII